MITHQKNVKNLVEVFENTYQKYKSNPCFRYVDHGHWITLDWSTVRDRIIKIAGGLRKLGVSHGDRVCILSKTRYEWTLTDIGIIAAGGVVVPIYESNIESQVEYIIEHSEAKVVFVENKTQYDKVKSIQNKFKHLKQIIYFDDIHIKGNPAGLYSLDELMMLGSSTGATVYKEAIKMIMPDQDVSYVYTSGTTGNPKGVILTHRNFISEITSCENIFHFQDYYESLVFLPFAHILARVVQYFQIYCGFIQCYAESIDKLLENISTIKPHFMASVPRIFEKIHMRTLQGVHASSSKKQKIFNWALSVGKTYSRLVLNKQKIPFWLKLQKRLAHKIVFNKLHQRLGGRIKYFISGGAPLSSDIASFFHAFGFVIIEGYGLTETTAAITMNEMDNIKFGSVGKPLLGADIKIAEDGEILVKGPVVFKGYFKDKTATNEAIDDHGWFHTGDVGVFDEEGRLKITDRKKDIIVTAGGKNIAPQNIENLIKSDPYISQIVVHGDKRKFLSALITLDQDEIKKYAKKHNISFQQYNDLVSNEKVYDFIRARIEEKNKQLAKYETIKRFAILPTDFTVESGELTPSLKIKRKVISQKYNDILNRFYE